MEDYNVVESRNTFAAIIAIEEYRFSGNSVGIAPVKFARNDAIKFKKLLVEDFNIPEENITFWIDKDATRSALENELKYTIRQLPKESRFIFYYAGHGFYQSSYNKITLWDTHPENLDGTSVSIKDVLLEPLETSQCEQSLIFIDSCSTYLGEKVTERNLFSNLSLKDFDEFIRSKKYNALYMSCSPGEKSYPSETLRNGIWTWHLIEALKGNVSDAIVNDLYITDSSLKNYLSIAIPKYITSQTTHKATQRPFAKINSSGDFLIRELPKIDLTTSELPKIKLNYNDAILRKVTLPFVSEAIGFLKGHFIPDRVNSSGNVFIQNAFQENIKNEIQSIYEKTKDILGLKRKDITTGFYKGTGSIECQYFRYFIEVEQYEKVPSRAMVTRRLVIRSERANLPVDFDEVFPKKIDEVVIPIEGKLDYDLMVDKFENLEASDGGNLTDNEQLGIIEYKTSSGITIKVDFRINELIVTTNRDMKCLELIDNTIDGLKKISMGEVKLLGR